MTMVPHPDWWSRLDSVFQGALEQGGDARRAFLDAACAGDTALRAEVDAMLAADAPEHALRLERLVHDDAEAAGDPFVGMRLGPWQIVEPLGHGGMGTVYLAERADGLYEQQVALKVIRRATTPYGAAARFSAETHILGRLSHPHIARLLDAGFTPEASAYLVMEHVDGRAITSHCDAERLSVAARLRLFKVVCEATQHAHQALVVHRDLKPSNIFVSRSGEVKLLDFGIAKLLEPDHPLAVETTHDMRALTPAYAAPEQLRGEPVTTAADVYVLGAVLYELLTGRRHTPGPPEPDAAHATAIAPPSQAARQAADRDGGPSPEARADARGTTPARLARQLEGDIDRVVLKALQYEPSRRYDSAGQFADDIGRALDGRPVMAQPDSVAYRTARFVRRHRLGAAMTLIVAGFAIAFAVTAALQARAVAIERDRARLAAARAERVSVLVADLFKLANPSAPGQTISARELLDQGTARIATELAGDPGTQAALFNVVGRVYGNLALHDTAITVLQRALEIGRKNEGVEPLTQAETLHNLGDLHVRKNDYAAAEGYFREALQLRRAPGAPAADLAETLEAFGRGLSFAGRNAEAEGPLREAVEIRRKDIANAAALMSSLNELAIILHRKGDMTAAEPLFREAVDVGRRIEIPSPEKVNGTLSLARLIHQFDRNAAGAEPYYREALTLARQIYPADHQDTAAILDELARTVRDLGRLTEAEAISRESLAMLTRLYGTQHRESMVSSQTLGSILRAQGRQREAEPLLREALSTALTLFGDGHPMTLGARRSLAALLEDLGEFPAALELREAELANALKAFGETDVYVALALAGLGDHALAADQPAKAEEHFSRALSIRRRLHPSGGWRLVEARGMLAFAQLRSGKLAAAESELLASYEGLVKLRGPNSSEALVARDHLHELYERWNRPDQAARFARPRVNPCARATVEPGHVVHLQGAVSRSLDECRSP